MSLGPDLDSWEVWWQHNRESYLEMEIWNTNALSGDAVDDRIAGGVRAGVVFGKVVPALKEALGKESSPEQIRALLIALARIGDGPEAGAETSALHDLFVARLDESNSEVVETACIALGILAHPHSLEALSGLMHDTPEGRSLVDDGSVSTRLQSFAAYGIGLLGARAESTEVRRAAAHTLVQALNTESDAQPDKRAAALIALGTIQNGNPLPEDLTSSRTCACSSTDELAKHVLELFENERDDFRIRAHAPNALANMDAGVAPETHEKIVKALLSAATKRSEKEVVRQGSIQALGHLVDADKDPLDTRVRKQLTKLSVDGRHASRSWATMALAEIGSRTGTGEGEPLAATEDIQRQLLKRLPRAKSQDEPWVALALGVLAHGIGENDPKAVETIGKALRDGLQQTRSPEKMTAYAIALGLSGASDATEALIAKLEKTDDSTRAVVAVAIGLAGEYAGIEELQERLHDARHTPGTLIESARSLALMRDNSVVKQLTALIDDCDCTLSKLGFAVALGRTRHPNAVEPLLAQFASKNQSEMIYATIGLGYLAEKGTLPWSARLSTGVHYRTGPATLTGSQAGILDLP